MAKKLFDVPAKLQKGDVIEWIPKGVSDVNGYIKFYGGHGQQLLCQKIPNGTPANLQDFYSLAQAIAKIKELAIPIPAEFNPCQRPENPIRCTFA